MLKTEIMFKNSNTSLNETQSNTTSSLPDIQLLIQEFESKVGSEESSPTENIKTTEPKDLPINLELHSSNNDNTFPLTFIIQVPNSILDIIKNKIYSDSPNNFPSEFTLKEKSKSNKNFFSVLQKLFRKKRKIKCIQKKDVDNLESTKLFGKKKFKKNSSNVTTESKTRENQSTSKNVIAEDIKYCKVDNSSIDLKTSCTMTLQNQFLDNNASLNIMPEKKSGNSDVKENFNQDKLQSIELLENLIKTLLKTTEKLENLQKTIKTLLECLNEKKIKSKKSINIHKNLKVKNNEESKAVNYLLQYLLADVGNKIRNLNNLKCSKKDFIKIPKRQSSKISVCSSVEDFNAHKELYKTSNLKFKHSQKHRKCHSPSMHKYLFCQSERDTNLKSISVS